MAPPPAAVVATVVVMAVRVVVACQMATVQSADTVAMTWRCVTVAGLVGAGVSVAGIVGVSLAGSVSAVADVPATSGVEAGEA